MVTTPYQRGRSREYKVLNILRKDGWVCSRSAMSHGPVDIFAAKGGRVLLIQVKSGSSRMSQEEADRFLLWSKAFNAVGEVWFFTRIHGLIKKRLYVPSKSPHNMAGRRYLKSSVEPSN